MTDESATSDLHLLVTAKDAAERNAAAIRLADARVPEAKAVLVGLISRPDLRDQRGTLVHCLGYFDCSDQFPLLVGLVVSGNFEVAHEAFEILELVEAVSGEQAEPAFEAIEDAQAAPSIEDWRRELLDELLEMFD